MNQQQLTRWVVNIIANNDSRLEFEKQLKEAWPESIFGQLEDHRHLIQGYHIPLS